MLGNQAGRSTGSESTPHVGCFCKSLLTCIHISVEQLDMGTRYKLYARRHQTQRHNESVQMAPADPVLCQKSQASWGQLQEIRSGDALQFGLKVKSKKKPQVSKERPKKLATEPNNLNDLYHHQYAFHLKPTTGFWGEGTSPSPITQAVLLVRNLI